MLDYLYSFKDCLYNGIFTWPQNAEGLPYKVFAGLISNKIIPEDSILVFEDKTQLVIMIATGDYGTELAPAYNEIKLMKECNNLSRENTFLEKLINNDKEHASSKFWYKYCGYFKIMGAEFREMNN